uniref:Prolow-density lipoprotein receptor-related protein 1-like n=1 Tax=Phallusia mammillata TaxID=59560 RepID=A0A6F9DK21_9ASCI|nr:prolow-density lipoprotein receptor-related protein 1-like [Phallusia mammillata]
MDLKPFLVCLIVSILQGSGIPAEGAKNSTLWTEVPSSGPYTSCSSEQWPYFFCENGINCFTIQQACDGHDDCGDSSDEWMLCPHSYLCPGQEKPIAMDKFCDGTKDCKGGEDELTQSNNSSFVCANAWRSVWNSPESRIWQESRVPFQPIARSHFHQEDFQHRCALPQNYVCDGINHCGDHSDECNDMCGPEKKFLCDNGRCISQANVCDWRDDCGDGSDERAPGCNKSFPCDDGTHIPFNKFCDGVDDCPDGSDEKHFANATTVTCSNRYNFFDFRCVLPNIFRCDGTEQCLHREDECTEDCNYSFQCKDGGCIVAHKKCDGRADCADMSDECGEVNCDEVFECDDGACLSLDRFCDGVKHCAHGEDEIDQVEKDGFHYCANRFNWIRKKNNATYSDRVCRLPERYMCDGIEHCDQRSDECQNNCTYSMFCDEGNTCLPRSQLCNGEPKCKDLKDEPGLKVDSLSKVKGFKCNVPSIHHRQLCVLPQEMVGDDTFECSDGSDVCFNDSMCATCRTNTNIRIRKSQVCDGVFDCPDLSDECFCYDVIASPTCSHSCFARQTSKCMCQVGEVPCLIHNGTTVDQNAHCIPVSGFCNGVVDCPNGADEMYCDSNQQCDDTCLKDVSETMTCQKSTAGNPYAPVIAKKCDGRPECSTMEDECESCQNPPEYCNKRSGDGFFTCAESSILPGLLVCDGIAQCAAKDDEILGCIGRMECGNGSVYSVEESQWCDFVVDCEFWQDEMNCSKTHFYCETGEPVFVQRRQMYDGKDDCADGSDECPPSFDNDAVFSSRYYLIKNHFLKVMVWIMGLLAIGGNLSVMVQSTRVLSNTKRRKLTKVAIIYNCLVLNLSLADFLMGIYLIALGIKDALSTGSYCKEDHSWRSGTTCASLGVLAVLSSEVSLTTLAILSTYRAYCVVRPVQSRGLNVCTTVFLAACTWIFASILAFIPFASPLQDYFISQVWVSHNPYFSSDMINKSEFNEFFHKLQNYINLTDVPNKCQVDNGDSVSWSCAPSSLAEFDQNYSVLGYYGYYSTHATCLPKIFTTREDVAWEFSIALTTLNFVFCLYIVLAYCVICRPRQINKSSFSSQSTRNMQKKIAILVASDCACWLPICTIVFLWFAQVPISSIVYAITAVILLPINSALNPLFYSNAIHNLFSEFANFANKINPHGCYLLRGGGRQERAQNKGRSEGRSRRLLEETEMETRGRVSRSESRVVTEHTFVDNAMNESVI